MRMPALRVVRRRRVLFGLAALAFAFAMPRARAVGPGDPTEPVQALNAGLLAVMKAGTATPFLRRYEMLAPVVDRTFDIPGILRACVGPRWSGLSGEEQGELLSAFRRFTIASYVANFDAYNNERFELLPDQRMVGADQVVPTRIVPVTGAPTRIDYVMRQFPDGWRAVDVLLDGSISRVAVQRSDFRSLIGAGDAAQLIASLQRKVADLSGGAMPS
jgi:phospholipid transport system substrate-binding protein